MNNVLSLVSSSIFLLGKLLTKLVKIFAGQVIEPVFSIFPEVQVLIPISKLVDEIFKPAALGFNKQVV